MTFMRILIPRWWRIRRRTMMPWSYRGQWDSKLWMRWNWMRIWMWQTTNHLSQTIPARCHPLFLASMGLNPWSRCKVVLWLFSNSRLQWWASKRSQGPTSKMQTVVQVRRHRRRLKGWQKRHWLCRVLLGCNCHFSKEWAQSFDHPFLRRYFLVLIFYEN